VDCLYVIDYGAAPNPPLLDLRGAIIPFDGRGRPHIALLEGFIPFSHMMISLDDFAKLRYSVLFLKIYNQWSLIRINVKKYSVGQICSF